MYGALWRVLPGPAWLRVLILLVLVAAVVLACFEWLFPLVAEYMPFNDPSVQSAGTGAASSVPNLSVTAQEARR